MTKRMITPVMDWQIERKLLDPDNPSPRRPQEALDLLDAITEAAKDAGLYHVDGDEGEEVLHFQFMLVDPDSFIELAEQAGGKAIALDGNQLIDFLKKMGGKDGDDS